MQKLRLISLAEFLERKFDSVAAIHNRCGYRQDRYTPTRYYNNAVLDTDI
jgi:hypothetical protein